MVDGELKVFESSLWALESDLVRTTFKPRVMLWILRGIQVMSLLAFQGFYLFA